MALPTHLAITILDTLWGIFVLYWLLRAFTNKKTIYRQTYLGRFSYLLVPVLIAILISHMPHIHQRFFQENIATQFAGILLTLAGIAFAIYARIILGGNWSGTVTLKQDHQLIEQGPYRWVRHPIYTGVTLAIAGTMLAIVPSIAGILYILLVAGIFSIKLRQEEALMRRQFPDAYPAYRARVRTAFLPFVY